LLETTKETKPKTTIANIHPQHRNTTAQNKHKKLKPGLVASYNFWSANAASPILQQLPGTTWSCLFYHTTNSVKALKVKHFTC